MENKKEESNIVRTKHLDETPGDVAISRCVQNLFATYGEARVRESMKILFNMKSSNKHNVKKKKAA